MRRMQRRDWVIGTAATLAAPALITQARAAEFNWRAAHTGPALFPLHMRLLEAAAEIKEKSGGRMELSIFGDADLGSAMGQLNQVRNGTLELAAVTGQILTRTQVMASLPTVGFAWAGYDTVWKAIDGDLGKLVRDLARDRSGLVVMDTVWDFGFRTITTSKTEIRTAGDLAGLRLRTPVEAEFVALFQALKANPIAAPLAETFAALANGTLDGQEGLLGLVVVVGFHTVQRFCAITNHVWDGHWLCVSPAHWRRLPDNLKTIVATSLNSAGVRQRKDVAEAEVKARETIIAARVKVNQIDPSSFRARLREAGYYRDLRQKLGPTNWDVLEKFTGKLA